MLGWRHSLIPVIEMRWGAVREQLDFTIHMGGKVVIGDLFECFGGELRSLCTLRYSGHHCEVVDEVHGAEYPLANLINKD
jgi:hypothetical protein